MLLYLPRFCKIYINFFIFRAESSQNGARNISNDLMWAQNCNKKEIIYTLRSELLIRRKKNLMKNPLNIIELETKSIAINILAIFFFDPRICIPIFQKKKVKKMLFTDLSSFQNCTRSIVMQMQCSESHVFYEPGITEWSMEIRTRPIW